MALKNDFIKITFLSFPFFNSVVDENAKFCCRNMLKKQEIALDQSRTADVVNEKATTTERERGDGRDRRGRCVLVGDAGGGGERRQVLLPGPCCYPVTVHRAEFATRVFGRLR